MKPHETHRAQAPLRVSFDVVTVSSSRYEKSRATSRYDDESGDVAASEIRKSGHFISARRLVSDSRPMIRRVVKNFLSGKADVLLLAGGTGVAKKDVTIETVRPFFEKELDGYGELVRRVSYDEIGSAAMMTRATAGVVGRKLIICLPGSPGAVKTALEATISEIPHVLYIAAL